MSGRGPAVGAWGNRSPRPGITKALAEGIKDRALVAGAAAILVLTGLIAWTTYQPHRAIERGDSSLAALDAGNVEQARKLANEAADIDQLSVEPYYDLTYSTGNVSHQ